MNAPPKGKLRAEETRNLVPFGEFHAFQGWEEVKSLRVYSACDTIAFDQLLTVIRSSFRSRGTEDRIIRIVATICARGSDTWTVRPSHQPICFVTAVTNYNGPYQSSVSDSGISCSGSRL